MKYIILLLLLVTGCQTTPSNPEYWMEREVNACLPTAIVFKQSLQKYGVWSEVFKYSWREPDTGKLRGHAMVAYLYPPGKNQLWTYDNQGSWRVRAYTNDVTAIAQLSHNYRGWTGKVFNAEYIR